MKKNNLIEIYNREYVNKYNEKYLTNPFSKISLNFELDILKSLINTDSKWLDVGCGTGYYLSQFPGLERAGLDISPEMIKEAREVNPDALYIREGDFRNDIPEWHNTWSLISCMWYPYSYLDTMEELERTVHNLVKWLSIGGDLFLPVADLEDFRPELPPVEYEVFEGVYGGPLYISGYIWSWLEADGNKQHLNMLAPHVEHFIRLLQPYFETIEIVRYPPAQDGWVSRRAIIARTKIRNEKVDSVNAKIKRYPIPENANSPNQFKKEQSTFNKVLIAASHKQLIGEILKRIIDGRSLKALFKKLTGRH
ncbi:MAG: class I SAM-dependent methyltransferase [Bacteroidia bacterium]